MSSNKNKLLTAVSNYLEAIKEKIGTGEKPIVFIEDYLITPETNKTYDLKDYVEDHTLYNLTSARVEVLVLDEEVGSPTSGYYIGSEAVVITGIKPSGEVIIRNETTDNLRLVIKIFTPTSEK